MQLLTEELRAQLPRRSQQHDPLVRAKFFCDPLDEANPQWSYYIIEGRPFISETGECDYQFGGWAVYGRRRWVLRALLSHLMSATRSPGPVPPSGEIRLDISFVPVPLSEVLTAE
jgi:hypothetical protein